MVSSQEVQCVEVSNRSYNSTNSSLVIANFSFDFLCVLNSLIQHACTSSTSCYVIGLNAILWLLQYAQRTQHDNLNLQHTRCQEFCTTMLHLCMKERNQLNVLDNVIESCAVKPIPPAQYTIGQNQNIKTCTKTLNLDPPILRDYGPNCHI